MTLIIMLKAPKLEVAISLGLKLRFGIRYIQEHPLIIYIARNFFMKVNSLMHKISNPLILDGGLSNVLESKGCDLYHSLWTTKTMISNPEAIIQAHLDYLNAGAQCITTCGYQASLQGFTDLGYDQKFIEKLILMPVSLAEEAIDRFCKSERISHRPLIAASIGPYGAYLADGSEYKGNYQLSEAELRHFHQRRIELLDSSTADILAVETIPSYLEAQVLTDLLDECQTPSWISFSCKDQAHLNDGTPISKACELIESADQVFAIGINCTAPNHISGLLNLLKAHAPSKKLVIYPNSGEVFNPKDKTWSGVTIPEDFASQALKWVQEGADIIGGCCRIGPEHISKIANALP